MAFEELWEKVTGLPDTAKIQVPGALSVDTKRKLTRLEPEKVSRIVATAEEVNRGSVKPLDELIRGRI
jgi:hypothetical protein